jgi:tRNA(adenine34) deaminase
VLFFEGGRGILKDDVYFMQLALEQARKAYSLGEVPIGAVLVIDGKVVAQAYNQVETFKDATAHAELLCLQMASRVIGNWRLIGSTLYSTLEPCSMCAGAAILSRIDTVVWGAPDLRHGANGSWIDLLGKEHAIHTLQVRRGVLEKECSEVIKQFFRELRDRK